MANNNGQKRRLPVAIRLEYKLLNALLFKYCDEEVTGTALLFNVLIQERRRKIGENRHNITKSAAISDLEELLKCSTQCIACFTTATLHRDKGCIKAAIQNNKHYGFISINDPPLLFSLSNCFYCLKRCACYYYNL